MGSSAYVNLDGDIDGSAELFHGLEEDVRDLRASDLDAATAGIVDPFKSQQITNKANLVLPILDAHLMMTGN